MQISAVPRHSPIMLSDRIHFDKTLSIKHFLYDKIDTTLKYCGSRCGEPAGCGLVVAAVSHSECVMSAAAVELLALV